MQTVKVNASKSYDVIIGGSAADLLGEKITELFGEVSVCVVSDDNVAAFHLEKIKNNLKQAGIKTETFVFPNGEKSKSPEVLFELLEFLAEKHFSRRDVLVALGGGVTGDLTGLAASMFMRGMRLVQLPTSLLAMVDSSVGGKTAVNLKGGKNLAGAFYQPDLVLCDTSMLSTLPSEIFADGMAEVIKYGVLADRRLFETVRDGGMRENAESIIARCVAIKSEFVCEDEFDMGKRQLLNLGHTLAHAVEKESGFEISHGKAVGMGMAAIAEIAWKHGLSAERCQDEIIDALLENGLPISRPFENAQLYSAAIGDKKHSGSRISLIIPEAIGNCKIINISLAELKELLS